MSAPGTRSGRKEAAAYRPVLAIAGAFLLAAIAARPAHPMPAVSLETHLMLHVGALVINDGKAAATDVSQDLEAGPDAPTATTLRIPLHPVVGVAAVDLSAMLVEIPEDGSAVVRVVAKVTGPGLVPKTASRDLLLREEGSSLFEIYGDDTRRILLVLGGERVERAVARDRVPLGEPVHFLLAIERVEGDRSVPLETNELNTFVRQPVEYSFRRGQDAGLETVRLSLLPVSISGDLITIQAEVTGALPGAAGPSLISHSERIVASRRATSTIVAAAGAPPAGYRFQVTPDF
ncbi:MAG TPA: hypothetical protein VMR65_10375 [Candidatus Sulfotelmatobacter sp.]|nr:hypothetical protein [Candidatus Sulfotelmatobacter sp.]